MIGRERSVLERLAGRLMSLLEGLDSEQERLEQRLGASGTRGGLRMDDLDAVQTAVADPTPTLPSPETSPELADAVPVAIADTEQPGARADTTERMAFAPAAAAAADRPVQEPTAQTSHDVNAAPRSAVPTPVQGHATDSIAARRPMAKQRRAIKIERVARRRRFDVAGPTVSEPTVAESAVTEPTVAEPTVTEPTVAEPTAAESAVAEPTIAEPTAAESAVAEPTIAEPTVTEPTVTEPTVAEPTVAESAVDEPTVAESAVVSESSAVEPTVATATPVVAEAPPAAQPPVAAEPTIVADTLLADHTPPVDEPAGMSEQEVAAAPQPTAQASDNAAPATRPVLRNYGRGESITTAPGVPLDGSSVEPASGTDADAVPAVIPAAQTRPLCHALVASRRTGGRSGPVVPPPPSVG